MELKDVVLTIIKILISVPAILIYQSCVIDGAALMGGHLDNTNHSVLNTKNVSSYSQEPATVSSTEQTIRRISEQSAADNEYDEDQGESEEIPNPSPLVLPGYNLPENIFNKGKPFYLEKDPLTGQIDFDKTPALRLDDDMYEYVDEEPSSNIYDKSNINRKDGSLSSHKPSDVNQLTPNFHDFLNLPVKYNPDKYVYPLISSSYANTKIQGNVNKFHNHKDYSVKSSTQKPAGSPTYYGITNKNYYSTRKQEASTTSTTSSTTQRSTTSTQIYLTTKAPSLINGGMSHPSFHEDFDYYDTTEKTASPSEIYLTTKNLDGIYLTTKAPFTSTKRTMSLFEQLFGDYDEIVTTTERTKSPSLFGNLPINKNKNKYEGEVKTEKPSYTTPSHIHYPNSHAGPNILSGSNMGMESTSYEYEDEYGNEPIDDNVAVENKVVTVTSTKITQPSTPTSPTSTTNTTTSPTITQTVKVENDTKPSPAKNDNYDLNTSDYSEYDYLEKENKTTRPTATVPITESSVVKVTSLPLGENHISSLNNRQPIIVATQNLREQLNHEKVPKPFGFDKPVQQPPSTSNIHIAPDQDTVSFVVGNHQNVDGSHYVATSLKESPYDSNPFRPLYGQQAQYAPDTVSYTIQSSPEVHRLSVQGAGSAVTIQPQKNSEASLAIGVPIQSTQQIPGQVVDEKLEINDDITYPKGTGSKIVFPDDREPEVANLVPPPPQPPVQPAPNLEPFQLPPPNREVLKLNSKPVYHQLPSDLTPPKEKEVGPPPRIQDRPRPPWDPRPGHFFSGKPEYVRVPRPPAEIAYKRIDNLPNILPQFRPNMKANGPPPYLNRQPLLDRPSNRPIGFFENLQPPPPPKNLHSLRKIPPPPPQPMDHSRQPVADDRIINDGLKKPLALAHDQFNFYQIPPKVVLPNRRVGTVDGDVETLQMIQAKNLEKKEILAEPVTEIVKDGTEKPLYVVYPVNTPPIKMDVIETNKKESVVIGTRAELPLPPSKINQNFNYEQNPILNPKDRNDAPILKPHPRPTFPIKSDFPYPLERPDPSVLNPAVPETPSNNGNNLDEPDFISGNQWNTVESRIVTGAKPQNSNQISATLKTYTERPIAVAYTPTEPHRDQHPDSDKYSMPNYASPVIPEIRLDGVEAALGKPDNEFTVSAVMHTHPQFNNKIKQKYPEERLGSSTNHKVEDDKVVPQLDFQAPFQASVNVDAVNHGWSIVRDRNKSTTESAEGTTLPLATTSEFDIENFKPQLEGGFKPIYNFPEESHSREKASEVSERQE